MTPRQMKETPDEMADRIEAAAKTDQDQDSREYGLAMASIIRKSARGEYAKPEGKGGRK